jgi:hypothetical protein
MKKYNGIEDKAILVQLCPYKLNLKIPEFARALGFEPRSKVLETRMLPLHHARI